MSWKNLCKKLGCYLNESQIHSRRRGKDQINLIEESIFTSSSFISLFKETKGLRGGPTDQPISWSAALTGMGFGNIDEVKAKAAKINSEK